MATTPEPVWNLRCAKIYRRIHHNKDAAARLALSMIKALATLIARTNFR
jgi:hypothetical protein